MQPPVLRIDVQYPLPGNAHPFRRHGDEREDKALEPALHVNAWEEAADLAQQVQVEVLQHGGEEQEHRVVVVVGQYGSVHVFHSGQEQLSLSGLYFWRAARQASGASRRGNR